MNVDTKTQQPAIAMWRQMSYVWHPRQYHTTTYTKKTPTIDADFAALEAAWHRQVHKAKLRRMNDLRRRGLVHLTIPTVYGRSVEVAA